MGSSKENTSKIVGEKVATVFGIWELVHDPELLLKEIGLVSSKVYRDIPKECCSCGYHKFCNLSLIGVYKKPIFYECDKCGALHLRYSQDWLEKKVLLLQDAYINPDDWKDEPPRSEYN